MYENLHAHTTTSDGELNYEEVLDACTENKISVVAFTDHDRLPGKKDLKVLEENKNHPTKWIMGIEISSGWPKEIGGAASNFHIVGLFIDPTNKPLKNYCKKAAAAREERARGMIQNLAKLGFDISFERIKNKKSLGRPHIVEELNKKKENRKLIMKYAGRASKKKDSESKKMWERIKSRDKKNWPYGLFLSENAIFKSWIPYLYFTPLDETVKLIREAGGIAILAHWSLSKHKFNKKLAEKIFRQKRLDGAEIIFCLSLLENPTFEVEKDMKTMKKLTEKYGLIQSGGGDSHTKEDLRFFTESRWAEKTKGMTRKILQKRNLNFSSFQK